MCPCKSGFDHKIEADQSRARARARAKIEGYSCYAWATGSNRITKLLIARARRKQCHEQFEREENRAHAKEIERHLSKLRTDTVSDEEEAALSKAYYQEPG